MVRCGAVRCYFFVSLVFFCFFYYCFQVLKPVNQRAQSRVPPPDDVDLSCAVDGSALDRLLAFEVSQSANQAKQSSGPLPVC